MRWICNDCNRKFMLRARLYYCPHCESANVNDLKINVKRAVVLMGQTMIGMKGGNGKTVKMKREKIKIRGGAR